MDEDTEWNDILRAKGILPPKPAEPESDDEPVATKSLTDNLSDLDLSDLDEELDLKLDDGKATDEEQRAVELYRQRRMAEMQSRVVRDRQFGGLINISQTDFVREVTDASRGSSRRRSSISSSSAPKGNVSFSDDEREAEENDKTHLNDGGVWVVVLLYQSYSQQCRIVQSHLEALAAKHPLTKFCKIIATECIPGYPDARLPTVIVYYGGETRGQIVGPEFGSARHITLEDIESKLTKIGAIVERPKASRSNSRGRRVSFANDDADNDDDDDEDGKDRGNRGIRRGFLGRN
ncbi:thioredoxin-like protein [Ramicandelaber brevisporus]|nr:thioredoxin-like protein [Ramicandelaber brevisporus]